MHAIAEGSKCIDFRCIDRTQATALSDQLQICGGARVPVVIFMSEDFAPCGVFGDRTLARYRAVASRQLGVACEVAWAKNSDEELHATLADWLDEFERVQRLCPERPSSAHLLLLLREDIHYLPRDLPPPQVQTCQPLPEIQETQNHEALSQGTRRGRNRNVPPRKN